MVQRKLSGSDRESMTDFSSHDENESVSSENDVSYTNMLQTSTSKKDIQYKPKLPTLDNTYSRQKERRRKKKRIEREINAYYSPSPSRSHSGSRSRSDKKKKKKKKSKTKSKDVFNRENITIQSDDNTTTPKPRKYRKKHEIQVHTDKSNKSTPKKVRKKKKKKKKETHKENVPPPPPVPDPHLSTVTITRRTSKHKDDDQKNDNPTSKSSPKNRDNMNNKIRTGIIVEGYLSTNIGTDTNKKWKKYYYTFNRDRLLCGYKDKDCDLLKPMDKLSLIHGRCSFNINSDGMSSTSKQIITITITTPKKPIIKYFRGSPSSLEKWKRAFLF